MTIQSLIEMLEAVDPAIVIKNGFKEPQSYRGFYDQLAVEPAENVRVADMLKDLRGAIGSTYHGYKGGEYTMNEYTEVYLAEYAGTGDELSDRLFGYMLQDVVS